MIVRQKCHGEGQSTFTKLVITQKVGICHAFAKFHSHRRLSAFAIDLQLAVALNFCLVKLHLYR